MLCCCLSVSLFYLHGFCSKGFWSPVWSASSFNTLCNVNNVLTISRRNSSLVPFSHFLSNTLHSLEVSTVFRSHVCVHHGTLMSPLVTFEVFLRSIDIVSLGHGSGLEANDFYQSLPSSEFCGFLSPWKRNRPASLRILTIGVEFIGAFDILPSGWQDKVRKF